MGPKKNFYMCFSIRELLSSLYWIYDLPRSVLNFRFASLSPGCAAFFKSFVICSSGTINSNLKWVRMISSHQKQLPTESKQKGFRSSVGTVMCQKQCRDENGFKCHCMSEGHQRQMQIFGQNPHRIVEGYSEEFETGFLDLMRRSHRFSRVGPMRLWTT